MTGLSALCYRAYAVKGKQAVFTEVEKQKAKGHPEAKDVILADCEECGSSTPHLYGECLVCGTYLKTE